MTKRIAAAVVLLLTAILTMSAQSYKDLWRLVEEAENNDLPQTSVKHLETIAGKATQEGAYGQLLKARLRQAKAQAMISPDSLKPAVARIEALRDAATDDVIRVVYETVLWRIKKDATKSYRQQPDLGEPQPVALTMERCERLGAVKAETYEPFVVKGTDSRLFDYDLLSVVAMEAECYAPAADYYAKKEKREAACYFALQTAEQNKPREAARIDNAPYLATLDSLIDCYADLDIAGEVAISRYDYMQSLIGATTEQAIAYIDEATHRWSGWPRIATLVNERKALTARQFSVKIDHPVWMPDHTQTLEVSKLRNISRLTMKVYKVDLPGTTDLNPNFEEGYNQLKKHLTPLPEYTISHAYSGHKDYELFTDSIELAALPAGLYMIECATTPASQVDRVLYRVSRIRVMALPLPDHRIRYVTVDAASGQPIAGVKLEFKYRYEDKHTTTQTTDRRGETVLSYGNSRPSEIVATTADDNALPELDLYGYYHEAADPDKETVVEVFTDRAIYRPGQTVHVAAIVYENSEIFKNRAVARQCHVVLRDANYKEIATKDVTTDDYGTCSADFVLPSSGLMGHFTVAVDRQQRSFRVEEYKRPTFEVKFDDYREDYKAGQTVTVTGHAVSYAGVPVEGARVSYTVERRHAWWWWSYSRYWGYGLFGSDNESKTLAQGETTTGADGTLHIDVPFDVPASEVPVFYNFVVNAIVTDQGGESHQGELSLPLGNREKVLTASLAPKVLSEEAKPFVFNLRNAAGNDIDATVRYAFDGGKWMETSTQKEIELPRLNSGDHTLTAECQGERIEQQFVVFSLSDKRPATKTDDWFYVSQESFSADGAPVTVQVGTSDANQHVVYTLIADNRIVEQGTERLSNQLINRKFTYRTDYGTGLMLCYAWMREGKMHQHTATIKRPLPDNRLRTRWITFRDRLTPGQQETWTLEVMDPDGKPADAQLLAVLYDKSLDQLVGHQLSLVPRCYLPLGSTQWRTDSWYSRELDGYFMERAANVPQLTFSTFDHDAFPSYYDLYRRTYRGIRLGSARNTSRRARRSSDDAPLLMAKASMVEEETAELDAMPIAAVDLGGNVTDLADEKEAKADEQTATEEVQLRENLNETAFFYPSLLADSTGRVSIAFTLPESLTTWKFYGVAHTKDLMYANISGETVAKKDVMIQPNMPRFLREGDRATLTARVISTVDRDIRTTCTLTLVDPATDQTVWQQQMPLSVEKQHTTKASFDIEVDQALSDYPLLVCRWTVSGDGFSDGEQHYLPVLSNRERVTVTVPFTQIAPGTKTIDLSKMLPKSGTDPKARLTVEYTNNPAWLILQALPSVAHPHDDCAFCLAAAYYTNAIGQYIIQQNPTAKQVFEAWKREAGNETSLMSALSKNSELKDLALDDTPWVIDADQETEQKMKLADFFDTNTIDQRLRTALDKLQMLQMSSGAWSWWSGMHESVYTTVAVSEMLVRLNHMTTPQSTSERMLDKAFRYMDNYFVELVAEMKKREKQGHAQTFPSRTALEYLYMYAIDGRKASGNVVEAHDYLKALLAKEIKRQTMYEKALTAIILDKKLYIQSLKEYTVYREDMGRYFDTPRAGYSWRDYRIPTQVAAIEALKRLTPADTATIDEMQRWLLQEKRTQAWDTPLNTVDAVYAFLEGNSTALAPQPLTRLAIDGKELATTTATAGLGYVKASQPADGAKTFTAEKSSQGTSWGAVYAQFMQPATDVAELESGLSVKRELFIDSGRRDDSGQRVLTPLTADHAALTVGTKVVVRITIKADRDYDFVEVQDKRAACLEPVSQLSGYRYGYYTTPRDYVTNYYFDLMAKGTRTIETEYYIDRAGTYYSGTCTAACAYAPEFRATTKGVTLTVSAPGQQ